MKIIKLDAIGSTNSFLKDLSQNSKLESYTTVVTKNQLNGRGQMDTTWISEPHKNLTFSILINDFNLSIENSKYINFATSLAIYHVLESKNISDLSIKWPNDIMADIKKVCGILIENTFTGNKIKNTILGIGLNVNQTNFESLQNATSIKIETNLENNLDELLLEIILKIKDQFSKINSKNYIALEEEYISKLYRFKVQSDFKTAESEVFSGKIVGISKIGNLQIQPSNGSIKEFGVKEVSFL